MSKQENMVVIAVTKEKLQDAYEGCLGMAEIIPALLKKQNYEGQGESDSKECRENLSTAANACLILLNAMMDDGKEAHHD